MIMSMLKFTLRPGSEASLVDVFKRNRILETASLVEGCWKLAMVAPQASDNSAYVIGFWEDDAAYQRWMDHPERGIATDELAELVSGDWDSEAAAQLMNVLHSVPLADAWSNYVQAGL